MTVSDVSRRPRHINKLSRNEIVPHLHNLLMKLHCFDGEEWTFKPVDCPGNGEPTDSVLDLDVTSFDLIEPMRSIVFESGASPDASRCAEPFLSTLPIQPRPSDLPDLGTSALPANPSGASILAARSNILLKLMTECVFFVSFNTVKSLIPAFCSWSSAELELRMDFRFSRCRGAVGATGHALLTPTPSSSPDIRGTRSVDAERVRKGKKCS